MGGYICVEKRGTILVTLFQVTLPSTTNLVTVTQLLQKVIIFHQSAYNNADF